MKKIYPYPYEFSNNVDLNNSNYSDTDKYPYAIIWGSRLFDYMNPSDHLTSSEGISCSLYDRKNNKVLPTNGRSTSFARGILEATIMQMLKAYEESLNGK
jgi:hypothetical protein